MGIPDTSIAVTLYNLRDFCETESDLDATLDKLCAIGYQAVQVSGVQLPVEVIARQLNSHGLYCCATHEDFETLRDKPQQVIGKLQALGCTFTALGCLRPCFYDGDPARLQPVIDAFNRMGPVYKAAGVQLGYHNHQREFQRIHGTKQTWLEAFYAGTDSKTVCAEIDLHWVTRGGGSPVAWINRVAGRMPVVHFKDFALTADAVPHECAIGDGNLDWPAIIEACRKTGVRWYSVEEDNPFPGHNIFDDIKSSFDYLKSLGVK